MAAIGTATIDFGIAPGTDTATIAVSSTSIVAGALVEAWIFPGSSGTVDHSVDEHRVEEIQLVADTIVAGTGFTVFGRTRNRFVAGTWAVAWAWST